MNLLCQTITPGQPPIASDRPRSKEHLQSVATTFSFENRSHNCLCLLTYMCMRTTQSSARCRDRNIHTPPMFLSTFLPYQRNDDEPSKARRGNDEQAQIATNGCPRATAVQDSNSLLISFFLSSCSSLFFLMDFTKLGVHILVCGDGSCIHARRRRRWRCDQPCPMPAFWFLCLWALRSIFLLAR